MRICPLAMETIMHDCYFAENETVNFEAPRPLGFCNSQKSRFRVITDKGFSGFRIFRSVLGVRLIRSFRVFGLVLLVLFRVFKV